MIPVMIGLAVALLGLAAVLALKAPTFTLEREISIAAPAEVVYAHVADFHLWKGWAGWMRDDSVEQVHGGAPSGPGATFSWRTANAIGVMRIVEASPTSGVTIDVESGWGGYFTDQMRFTFTPAHGGTRVRWSMRGRMTWLGKLKELLMSIDASVGKELGRGLEQLKQVAEAERASAA